MKKKGERKLEGKTDIKIFLLYLLDNIRYPIDYATLSDIIAKNTDEITISYAECLSELVESGHLWYDELDNERYYMISDSGRLVAAELYDTLDPDLRERSVASAARYVSLQKGGAECEAEIIETENRRYVAHLVARDSRGEILNLSITVATRAEAELIKSRFEKKPDATYRGVLFATSGRFEFFS